MRALRALGCAFLAALLTGCALTPAAAPAALRADTPSLPSSVEIDAPFFSQEVHQCGPAALATVLVSAGVEVTPESLANEIYIPKRKGSLQPELIAAIRARDRLPYLLEGELGNLLAEVAAGRPVLVLQNLGLRHLPAWHYAVVVGYDLKQDQVMLRSGKTQRLVVSTADFEKTWALADHWAVVALTPGTGPARADLQRYMSAAAAFEELGNVDAAERSYRYAREQWPQAALPWLGVANLAQARGELVEAQQDYLEAIARDPSDPIAYNNLADTLARRGCLSEARREIGHALELARGTSAESVVRASAQELAVQADADQRFCFVTP